MLPSHTSSLITHHHSSHTITSSHHHSSHTITHHVITSSHHHTITHHIPSLIMSSHHHTITPSLITYHHIIIPLISSHHHTITYRTPSHTTQTNLTPIPSLPSLSSPGPCHSRRAAQPVFVLLYNHSSMAGPAGDPAPRLRPGGMFSY